MGFFHANETRLPKRGGNKLPLREKRGKQRKDLKQFEVGHLYTFTEYFAADLPEDLPHDILVEDLTDGQRRNWHS